jgi:hypothetical protein
VLNGSAVSGAAKHYSELLLELGYQLTNPTGTNAASTVPATRVLYAAGYATEANAVADAVGAPREAVSALGSPPPGVLNGAQVVVVIGPDLA